jgi:hypothetical protein
MAARPKTLRKKFDRRGLIDGLASVKFLGKDRNQREVFMASARQRAAARRNIGKAAAAARRKRTIAHLPKRTRTALGKQAAKVAKRKRK